MGFRELSVKAETDGTLSMTAAFSAVGFRVEEPAAMEKMDLQAHQDLCVQQAKS